MRLRNRLDKLEKAAGGSLIDGLCRRPAPLWRALRPGETEADAVSCPDCGLPYRVGVKTYWPGANPDVWDEQEATGEPEN